MHIQHMHKALTQLNLQIHHVFSDITGISGMAIIEAIVAGQRDPLQLAGLCHAKVHADRQTVFSLGVVREGSAVAFRAKVTIADYTP